LGARIFGKREKGRRLREQYERTGRKGEFQDPQAFQNATTIRA